MQRDNHLFKFAIGTICQRTVLNLDGSRSALRRCFRFQIVPHITSARGPAGRCWTLIPSVYWQYIITQHRRAIAAFADGNALNGWQRSSKAWGGALISAALNPPRMERNYYDISMVYRGMAGEVCHFAGRSGAPKFCPWRSVKCRKAPRRTADRRPLRAEYRRMPAAVIAACPRSSLASIARALTLKAWT